MHPNSSTPTQGAINVATAIADISISGFSNQRFQQATSTSFLASSKLSSTSKPKSSQQQTTDNSNPFDVPASITNLHPKFRLTFYICSIGFTSSILFDEQKRPYHLMLQRFDQLGGLKSLFDAFYWSLSLLGNNSTKTETINSDGDSASTSASSGDSFQQLLMNQDRDKLHEGTLEFIEAWLTLIQKLVNTKNMLETRHSVNPNSSSGGSSLSFYTNPTNLANLQGDVKKVCSFDPIKFLFKVHKESFQALMCLWENKSFIIRENYSLSETVLNILCQILIGDSQLQKKLAEQQQAASAATASANTGASSSLGSRSNFSRDPRFAAMQSRFSEAAAQLQATTSAMNTDQSLNSAMNAQTTNATSTSSTASAPIPRLLTPLDNELIVQMISMGFSAELAHEAVSRSPPDSLEQAVEYCFNHPNGSGATSTETTTTTAATTSTATATVPASTTTSTSSNLAEILSNINYTTSTNEPATPVIEVSSTLPSIHQSLANIQQTIDSIEDSVNEATRMAAVATASSASRRDEKENVVKMEENQSSTTSNLDDSDQIHQLDKVILDKFANNMLPGLTKILDNVPDTVYRVCDLIVVVVKKYGDQWRDNSLLYILNETCDLIKQVCDIYATSSKSTTKSSGKLTKPFTMRKISRKNLEN